jgi:PAT family beta-lactamase induction signal transducer AmpG
MGSEAAAAADYRGWAGTRRAFATPAALAMTFLGFGSGMPFLLVGATLSTRLRDEGLALGLIGLISFAGFFYVFKFLWAPLLDRYAPPFLGRRRGWLLAAQAALAAAIVGLALHDPQQSLGVFVTLVALAAFAGATQDTMVDAYRIEIAPADAQAALAATYSLGYRAGMFVSGAICLYLAELAGWRTAYLAMAALYLMPMAATVLCREPPDGAVLRAERGDLVSALVRPVLEFFQRNGAALAVALLAFVGLFKLPDQMIGVLAGPFYLDTGYTKADIATVSKLYGVWIGLGGAFLGGVCVAAFGIKRMLVVAAVAVAASNLAFLLMARNPSELWAFFATITADNVSQGFAGTVLIAFMSGLTDRRFTATQYALMVSLANLPGKIIGGVSGYIVEATSYQVFFVFSCVSVVPTLLLMAWLWPRLERRAEA